MIGPIKLRHCQTRTVTSCLLDQLGQAPPPSISWFRAPEGSRFLWSRDQFLALALWFLVLVLLLILITVLVLVLVLVPGLGPGLGSSS